MTLALDLIAKILDFAVKEEKVADPKPLSIEALDALEVALGCALPPSLRAWLAFDTGWLKRGLGWFDGTTTIPARPVEELVESHSGDLASPLRPFLAARLPGAAVALDSGSDSLRFLSLGDADTEGEYPVLFVDHDVSAVLGVEFPSFAVWLANEIGLWKEGVARNKYKKDTQAVSQRIFGKKSDLEPDGEVPKKLLPYVAPAPPGAHAEVALPKPSATKAKKRTDSALVKAIEQGAEGEEPERVKTLLAEFAARKLDGAKLLGGALTYAAGSRGDGVVAMLLDAGAPPNTESRTYGSVLALAAAASAGKERDIPLGSMRALLRAGADPNGARRGASDADGDEYLPLLEAGRSGRIERVRVLLEGGADPNIEPRKAYKGHVPVLALLAAHRQLAEILSALLQAGARVNSAAGKAPLHWAAREGNGANVDVLVNAGADLDALDAHGDTALHLAFWAGSYRLASRLAQRGARRDIPGYKNFTMDRVFDAQGRDVRPLHVKLFATDAPQTLRITLDLSKLSHPGRHVVVDRFLLMATAGGAYSPGTTLGTQVPSKFVATEGESTFRGSVTVETPPLDPKMLALALRSLFAPGERPHRETASHSQPTALSIEGSATRGTAIDAATMRAWIHDPALTIGPQTTPFPLTILEGPGAITIEPVSPLEEASHEAIVSALEAFAGLARYLPGPSGLLFDADGFARVFGVNQKGSSKTKATFAFGRRWGMELDADWADGVSKDAAVDALRAILASLHARVPLARASFALPKATNAG
jgi:hypothetical protein